MVTCVPSIFLRRAVAIPAVEGYNVSSKSTKKVQQQQQTINTNRLGIYFQWKIMLCLENILPKRRQSKGDEVFAIVMAVEAC